MCMHLRFVPVPFFGERKSRMFHTCGSRELGHENLQNSIQIYIFTSPCKFRNLHYSLNTRVSLGFNLYNQHSSVKRRNCSLHSVSPSLKIDQTLDEIVNLHTEKQNSRVNRVSTGFKLQTHSRPVVLPTRTAINGKKKRYGGVLPSILRSLESEDDIEKTLDLYDGQLSPKEQTVILKEQRSWERVFRVFKWMKSQKEYLPNVIHYNVVLRALGRAKKWNELRLCWIEMAKNGVLPTNNTYGMLADVYGKAGLVKEALLWIKHMRLRGMFPDEVTMNTAVRVLKDAGEYDRADKFYKDWCVGRIELDDLDLDSMADSESGSFSEPISLKHFLLTELFKTGGRNPPSKILVSSEMESCVKKPRLTATYNTLIDLYGKAGRLKDAADVFAEMLKSGVAVDTFTFNTMIFTCGSHGHLPEAESLLSKMEERGISPDTKTYNIFLSLYADVGNMDASLQCYRKIKEVGLFPDVVTYRAVLHTLCERSMIQEVEAVLNEMDKSGVRIDEHSLPVVIKMYVNEGLLERAKILLEKCQLDGRVSSRSYAAIIDAYADKGLWAEAEAVFYRKRDLGGQKKDVVEYNVMIKAYGKAKLYDKAFSLFKNMKNHGTWPDECSYNSIIQMFAGGDLVDQAMDLLAEMRAVGFKPTCLTYSAVIASYARLSRLSDAVDVYQEMVGAEVKPNEVVYGSLINGFSEAGRVEEALHYFHIMKEFGISANQVVLTTLIKAYSKVGSLEGAKQLYEKMKDLEGGPDIVASNSMLNLYADLGLESEARLVFDHLKEKGWADGVTFATMMYLYKNMGMLDEAIDIAEEMKESGLLRDCVSFKKVMACYATNGQLVECGELLHEMASRKILPDGGTFKVLFTVLRKGGIPNEAVTQLELCYKEGKPFARQAVITCVFSVVGLHAFALESCEILTKAEVGFDTFPYNVLIYAYGASGEINQALNVFMKMQDEGLEPDLVTFINLVGCYGKAGMVEGVKRIYSQLKYGEIEPNESLFKAIIDAYKNNNRHDLAEMVNQEKRFAFDTQHYADSEIEDDPDETSTEFTDMV
ncbi:pentatricopeptide repeat-containing protein At1g73710 [Cornus florida]|uniref:pentatricopeptide repeat-containing protein At1g73710 n=1 Tax=Cornus florida TaxID=4283 RepID=UPI00289FB399|nr:pentatricopeptide repeat-containing protein At1g73710 [Cornus florida]